MPITIVSLKALSKQLTKTACPSVQAFLQNASSRTTMLLFTKIRLKSPTKLNHSHSQDHSVYIMVQLVWVLRASGILCHWKRSFTNRALPEAFGPKASFLLPTFPGSPRSSALPVKPTSRCTHKKRQQPGVVRKPPHILLGLFFCSRTVLGWGQVEAGPVPRCSPFHRYEAFYTLYCVCAKDLVEQQGRATMSVSVPLFQ